MSNITASATYLDTPDLVREAATLTVPVETLRRGDVIKDAKVVTGVKLGTKWVYVSVEGRKSPMEFEVGTDIDATRMVPTDESVAIHERGKRNYKMAVKIEESRRGLEAAAAKVAEKVAAGQFLGYSEIDSLMAENGRATVWAQFADFAERNAVREDEENRVADLVEARERFTQVLIKRLTGSYEMTRALSKSTSVVANLMNDVEREAIASFLEDARWDY